MNILKENMAIPLYIKKFDDISRSVEAKVEQNSELLWIMKEGFTVTSIGLHDSNNKGL